MPQVQMSTFVMIQRLALKPGKYQRVIGRWPDALAPFILGLPVDQGLRASITTISARPIQRQN